MLFFNNLVINMNSPTYVPMLFHLTSFRRRVLSEDEFICIKSMIAKQEQLDLFSEDELKLYHNLVDEKQIIDTKTLEIVDEYIMNSHKATYNKFYLTTDIDIGIQITQDCNMNCSYCYEKRYLTHRKTITTEMIDSIQTYFEKASEIAGEEFKVKLIRITGGEPLLNEKTVGLINYCTHKWPSAKLNIQTNGINLLKYYDLLPLDKVNSFAISLDGIDNVHLSRRFTEKVDKVVYENIIGGIKRLLMDGHKVFISTVLDKSNYMSYSSFKDYLEQEGIAGNPNCRLKKSIVTDFNNELGIDTNFNNKSEILKITEIFYEEFKENSLVFYPGSIELSRKLYRQQNSFVEPSCFICRVNFFNKNFFAANGKVYICDCVNSDKGIIGTYFPQVMLDMNTIMDMAFNLPIFHDEKCRICPYKYLCLGGCPLMARANNQKAVCGIFADDELLDNLCFDTSKRHR